jgi:hypothetical protein
MDVCFFLRLNEYNNFIMGDPGKNEVEHNLWWVSSGRQNYRSPKSVLKHPFEFSTDFFWIPKKVQIFTIFA